MVGARTRSRRGVLRRGAALAAAVLVLRAAYAGADLTAVREGLSGIAGSGELARSLVEEELGGLLPREEGVFWDELVRSQLPVWEAERETPEISPAAGEEQGPLMLPAAADGAAGDGEDAPVGEEDEAQEPSPVQEASPADLAVPRTMGATSKTVVEEGVCLNNNTDHTEVELSRLIARELPQTLSAQGPQILIMHTHGSEAYTMDSTDIYQETDTARTPDPAFNVIRVGEEMKRVFEEMGLSVIHDTTLYDYPAYTGSYTRSLEGTRQILEEYPTVSIVLDVHRDALIGEDGTVYKAVTEGDVAPAAQVMLVLGSEDGGLTHPGWEDNLTLALRIQQEMCAIEPTLPRPVNLRSQRFNQHLTAGSILVEVGTHGNTLQEALEGARLFARAAGEVFLSLPAV